MLMVVELFSIETREARWRRDRSASHDTVAFVRSFVLLEGRDVLNESRRGNPRSNVIFHGQRVYRHRFSDLNVTWYLFGNISKHDAMHRLD